MIPFFLYSYKARGGRVAAKTVGASGAAGAVAAKALARKTEDAAEVKKISFASPRANNSFHMPGFQVEWTDLDLKRRLLLVFLGLSGSGASCYRYEISDDGLNLIIRYSMPCAIAFVPFLMDSFFSTFHQTSSRMVGLKEAINSIPPVENRSRKKEGSRGPGFTMVYRLPFRVGSKAIGYNGAKGVVIEDRPVIDDDDNQKVVTLLHYDFIALEDEEDNNIIDGTKSIEEMFCRPKKRPSPADAFLRRGQAAARHPSDEGENNAV